jgi:SAM-dependent methyltransferase
MDETTPWLRVTAADYEGHMGPGCADQLGPLAAIFGEVLRLVRPARVALLGCATGNGLEHVDLAETRQVLAVDVNPAYVAATRERHARLGAILSATCADLERWPLPAGAFDLVHAALVLEHVDPDLVVPNLARSVAPSGHASVVLQLPSAETRAVTPSPIASIMALEPTFHLLAPDAITERLGAAGLGPERSWTVPVKNGKALYVGLYARR